MLSWSTSSWHKSYKVLARISSTVAALVVLVFPIIALIGITLFIVISVVIFISGALFVTTIWPNFILGRFILDCGLGFGLLVVPVSVHLETGVGDADVAALFALDGGITTHVLGVHEVFAVYFSVVFVETIVVAELFVAFRELTSMAGLWRLTHIALGPLLLLESQRTLRLGHLLLEDSFGLVQSGILLWRHF